MEFRRKEQKPLIEFNFKLFFSAAERGLTFQHVPTFVWYIPYIGINESVECNIFQAVCHVSFYCFAVFPVCMLYKLKEERDFISTPLTQKTPTEHVQWLV